MKNSDQLQSGLRQGRFVSIVMAMLGVMFFCTGCQIPGFFAEAITGGEKVPAVYKLKDVPTVIVVDDYYKIFPNVHLATLIAEAAGKELADEGVIDQIIPQSLVNQAKVDHENFSKWSIDHIGRQVGAKQVIYVVVSKFTMVEEAAMLRPTLSMRVKVIDVASGARLFPSSNKDGHPVTTSLFYRSMENTDEGQRSLLARRLMTKAGGELAKQFYKHRPPDFKEGQ